MERYNDHCGNVVLRLTAVFLTLGAHAQRGLRYLVRVCVCPSVTTFSATMRNKTTKEQYQKIERYTDFI